MESKTGEVAIKGYYDFEKTLDYIRLSKSAILEKVSENLYERVFRFEEQLILVSVQCKKYGSSTSFVITAKGEEVNDYIFNLVIQKIHHIFSFNKGGIFDEISKNDLVFSSVLREFKYVRPILIGEPYEALIWSIIGQQINVKFAEKLRQRFLELCGATTLIDGQEYYYIPTPEQVISISKEDFQRMQFSKQKTEYILSLSKAIVKGELDLGILHDLTQKEATEYLTNFKGIGKWTADSILMRGIGFQNIFPSGDVGLQRIVRKAYKLENISEVELEKLSQNWSPNRSWAAFLWWFALQYE